MLNKLKLLLRIDGTDKDALLNLVIEEAENDFQDMTGNAARPESILLRMAVTRYNLISTEGLASQSINGMNETYSGYDKDLVAAIKRYRKVKVV